MSSFIRVIHNFRIINPILGPFFKKIEFTEVRSLSHSYSGISSRALLSKLDDKMILNKLLLKVSNKHASIINGLLNLVITKMVGFN